ncbi:MAG: ATP-binding protein [Nevskiales bacterium]|nr:ATP-binding protein [Nevskiales bacterium]
MRGPQTDSRKWPLRLSLRTRLLLAASVTLLVFIALCGAGLENAFRDSALTAQQERMQGLIYALLGAAEQDDRPHLTLSNDQLPEPRLRQPQSGLEAAVLDESGATLWQSPSAGHDLPVVIGPEVGHWKFERLGDANRFVLSFGLRWISDNKTPHRYTVLVLETPDAYEARLTVFRRTLWLWLLAAAAALLVVLALMQDLGLSPLRRLVAELRGIETGRQSHIGSLYPRELRPLTGALNALLRSERSHQQRYSNALGDLAHSLKTPLAVLRGLDSAPLSEDLRRQLQEQTGRMQQIVDHQLARAATAGPRPLGPLVLLRPAAEKVMTALKKVHADRGLQFELRIPAELQTRAAVGDLYELLGNPLDNAAKWAHSRVRLRAHQNSTTLILEFEDDGPGFPERAEQLLGRGVRADSRTPGQGLGLAAVAEIVRAYEGTLELDRSSELNGARIVLKIPHQAVTR